jgi:methyl-accepting chemotaxis protein
MNDVTYGSEDITSLSFDSGSISGETYQIGSTYMNSIQIIFPSLIETVKEDMELLPELGVLVNGTYEYTKLGHFFIDEFERNRNNNTTTIKATDKMRFMEGPYESKLSYPRAYKEVALEIANLSGVEVNQNSFASLGIGAINKPEGYTFRQAIGLIAQFEGGFASFNRNGELEIRRLAPTNFEITPESYMLKGFTKNEVSYRIGGISVKTGEEETDVIRVGSTNGSQVELENKVMTQTLLNQMWELVKTLNYFPYELKWRGCPPLEAGDWIYVTANDGTKYSVPNLSYSITFNGGMSAESKATTSSSPQATYKYRGPLNQRIDYLDSILSSNNWNSNYYDTTEPLNPKEGDIWFKPNGQDTEIWVYKNIDGFLKWVMEITSAGDPELLQAIEDAKQAGQDAQAAGEAAQQAAEDAKQVGEAAKVAGTEAKAAAEDAEIAAEQAKAAGEAAQQAANDAKQAGNNAAYLAGQAQETADQVNNRIGDVVIDIGDIQGDITAIVSEVGDVQTDISKIISDATSTASKANEAFNKASAVEGRTTTLETSVGNIKSTMTDIETDLDSTTKKINEVSTTVDGQITEIASVKSTATSALNKANIVEQTVDGVKTTLTSVQESIAGAEIRNLQLGTQFMTDDMFLNKGNSTFIDYETHRSLRIIQGNTSTNLGLIPVVEGEKLAISFDVRSLGAVAGNRLVLLQWYENETTRKIYTWYDEAYSTDWKRINTLVTVPADVKYFSLGFRAVYNTLEYKLVKISKGTTTKDWSPAPEDLATVTKVNELTTTVDGNTSKIASVETTATSALSKANVAQSTADGNTTKITAAQTTATNALTKANTVEQTVDGQQTTITSIQNDLANVSQGTTNLLKNSSFYNDTTGWSISAGLGRSFNGEYMTIEKAGVSSARLFVYQGVGNTAIQPDTEYSLAFMYYIESVSGTSGSDNAFLRTTTSSGLIDSPLYTFDFSEVGVWKLATANGKSKAGEFTANSTFYIAFSQNRIVTMRLKEVILVKGKNVKDWSPAPSDLATVTKVNQITETVDGHTQLIASTTNTANSALSKANSVSSTVDGLTVKVTSVETTANAANSKALQVEATADGLTSAVTDIRTEISDLINRFPDPDFSLQSPKPTIEGNINTSYDSGGLVLNNTGTSKSRVYWGGTGVALTVGKTYYIKAYVNSGAVGATVEFGTSAGENISHTFTSTQPVWVQGVIKATSYSAISVFVSAGAAIRLRELYVYEAATDITSSQITQLSTDINLKVSKGDVINQINVGTESILIAGNKLNITAQTTIDNAVIKTAHIVDLAVSNGKIANLAVTEGKIGNLAVTNAKIASLAVTEGKIGDASITTAKIGNLAVSEAKIADLAVSSAKIANLAVTETKIGDAAITNAKIGDLAVSTAKIADAAITDAKIGNLSATKITTGTLNAANVNIVNLNANSISTGELTGINIRAATFYGSSGSGNMQLNGVDLRFDTSSNSFRLNYNGIVNVNTSYGTRALAFFNEGINIAASSSNSGNFRNSGLTLSGDSTYVDFYSIGSTSANGRLLYSGNSMTLNNFRTGKRISLANNFDLYVSSLNVHKTNDSDWSGVYAASFTNSSERRLKTNLVLLKDSLSVLQKMKFYEYDRIDTLQHQLGPVLDEAPEKIIQGQGIDQYSFITLVATSLQEHAKKTSQDIDMLVLKIDNLQNEFNQLRNAS